MAAGLDAQSSAAFRQRVKHLMFPLAPLCRYAGLQQQAAHIARELEALELSLSRAAKTAAAAARAAATAGEGSGAAEAAQQAAQQHMELAKVI